MARRVFFHIGLPKAGTTFLQTTMWHNRDPLKAQGFLYPGSKRMDHYHASRVVRGAPERLLGDDAGAWDALVRELAAWPGTGLVSHEFFSLATRRKARRAVHALRPAQVEVVVTVRDYVRQFPAVWQEALKMNSGLSFDEFMERALAFDLHGAWGWRSQDIPAVLERWSAIVSPEHVHVITVPPPGAPRNVLWDRWCEVLGIDDSDFDLDVAFSNESLGAPQAALMQRLKPHLSGPLESGSVRHRWVRQYFGHEVLVPQGGPRYGPRPHHVAELRRLSQMAAKAIDSAGYPVTGDLSDLVPEENQPDRPHPDDVTDSELLDVALRAIEQMIRDVRERTEWGDSWRREALQARRLQGSTSLLRRVRNRLRRQLRT